MQTPFRLDPKMPAHAYTTYALVRPRATHYRPAGCQEVECAAHRNGWVTRIDTSSPLGARQANYIRLKSGRHFSSKEIGAGMVHFTFPPGQQCFASHRVPLQREPIFLKRGGDWRGNPRGERVTHVNGADWVDDFAGHLSKLASEHRKG